MSVQGPSSHLDPPAASPRDSSDPFTFSLKLREAKEVQWDVVSLGEVMLRLDPGDRPISSARSFEAWEGGGEYNVARAASAVFGLRSAILTALVDNEVGGLIKRLMLAGGVDTRFVKWVPFDGIGKAARNPLNFTDRGFGVRSAVGVSDRAYSPASQLQPEDFDWEEIFSNSGVRWFHTGGIFAGLSEQSAQVASQAIAKARDAGTVVSYDLNYRPSLWTQRGGKHAARELNTKLAAMVDILIGNEEDYADCLGIEVKDIRDVDRTESWEGFEEVLLEARRRYPNVRAALMTLRRVHSASRNDWSGMGVFDGHTYKGPTLEQIEIYDRVGGGDGFVSGFVSGILNGKGFHEGIDQGIAHGALAMTTPGDVSLVSRSQVERLARGAAPRVVR